MGEGLGVGFDAKGEDCHRSDLQVVVLDQLEDEGGGFFVGGISKGGEG